MPSRHLPVRYPRHPIKRIQDLPREYQDKLAAMWNKDLLEWAGTLTIEELRAEVKKLPRGPDKDTLRQSLAGRCKVEKCGYDFTPKEKVVENPVIDVQAVPVVDETPAQSFRRLFKTMSDKDKLDFMLKNPQVVLALVKAEEPVADAVPETLEARKESEEDQASLERLRKLIETNYEPGKD